MSDEDTGADLGTMAHDVGPGGGTHDQAAAMPESAVGPGVHVEHDSAWFDQIFATHTTAVYRFFVRRAPLDDAEDLTADVFTTAWRRRDVVPDGAELPWLYQTAGYLLANHRRKGRPEPVEVVPEVYADDDPADLAVADDELKLVLAQLAPRDRRILLLNAWEGLTGDDLAVALGISRGGADAALSRARSRLRAAWGELDGHHR